MAQVIANGTIVDIIFAFMVLEAIALTVLRFASGRGLPLLDVLALLLPGAFLLLALREALTSGSWIVIAACLTAALLTHAADLWRRHART